MTRRIAQRFAPGQTAALPVLSKDILGLDKLTARADVTGVNSLQCLNIAYDCIHIRGQGGELRFRQFKPRQMSDLLYVFL